MLHMKDHRTVAGACVRRTKIKYECVFVFIELLNETNAYLIVLAHS